MAVAVICEFNPFHNGHKYLLQQAKARTGEPIIAIMSGSFTQRGEVAISDKHSRCEIALKNGADLVLELPAVYAVSNAQRFAECGVRIASFFKSVSRLAFGCESDNTALLQSAADSVENEAVKRLLAEKMRAGEYYPRALEKSVREVLGNSEADILTSPNNILAVEYLRALKKTSILPLAIRRAGAEHDSRETVGSFASASHIRQLLRSGEECSSFAPELPERITYPEKLDLITLYRLRTITAEELRVLPDVGEGLENRIIDAVKKYNSVEEILSDVKTKRYTHARLRRILTCAVLGITEKLQTEPIEYARVLGFNKNGAGLLKDCEKELVTSPAKALKSGDKIAAHLKKDIAASDILALAFEKTGGAGSDFTTEIVKIQ